MTQPIVSIIIPAYNHQDYILETLESIIQLDYKPIELLIINDGSTDNTLKILNENVNRLSNELYSVNLISRENRGLISSLNEGIALSQGKYIKIIASDDTLEPDILKDTIPLMEKDNLDILFVNINKINGDSKLIASNIAGIKGIEVEFVGITELTLERALDFNRFFGPAYIANAEVFSKIGPFNSEILIEDWEYMLRCIDAKLLFGYLPKPLVNYREHGENSWKRVFFILEHNLKILNNYKTIGNHKKRLGVQYNKVINALLLDKKFLQTEWNQLNLSMKSQQFSVIDFFPSMIKTLLNFHKLKLKNKN